MKACLQCISQQEQRLCDKPSKTLHIQTLPRLRNLEEDECQGRAEVACGQQKRVTRGECWGARRNSTHPRGARGSQGAWSAWPGRVSACLAARQRAHEKLAFLGVRCLWRPKRLGRVPTLLAMCPTPRPPHCGLDLSALECLPRQAPRLPPLPQAGGVGLTFSLRGAASPDLGLPLRPRGPLLAALPAGRSSFRGGLEAGLRRVLHGVDDRAVARPGPVLLRGSRRGRRMAHVTHPVTGLDV